MRAAEILSQSPRKFQSQVIRPDYWGNREHHEMHGGNTVCGCGRCQMGISIFGIDLSDSGISNFLSNSSPLYDVAEIMLSFDWPTICSSAQDFSQKVAEGIYTLNPVRVVFDFLKSDPLTKSAFGELDKFTGGLLTTTENLGTLPERYVAGDPISKTEVLNDALLAIKIGAVIVTGGTAAAFISAGAAQLSQGTLGNTTTGKIILGIISAAAGAYAITEAANQQVNQDISENLITPSNPNAAASFTADTQTELTSSTAAVSAGEQASAQVAAGYGTKAVLTAAKVNDPLTNLFLTQVGAQTGGTAIVGGDTQAALDASAQSAAENTAISAGASQYPPYGGLIAQALIDGTSVLESPAFLTKVGIAATGDTSTVSQGQGQTQANGTCVTYQNTGQVPSITLPTGQVVNVVSYVRCVNGSNVTYTYTLSDGSTYMIPAQTAAPSPLTQINIPVVALAAVAVFFLVGGS